ncbi:hypothetical protein [Microbacterium sp. NPDC079176]|uniref:hypothetical protein n=1 Tax=Microbacterium sp. NPDC079176 TaxID=3154768 RepID=UPI003436683E
MSRRWQRVDLPSKTWLSESEAMDVLRRGADPAWFEPAYQRAVVIPHRPERAYRYGLIRIYGDPAAPEAHDIQLFWDREGLSGALEVQWSDLIQNTRPGEPRLPYDVFFFELDQSPRLYLVIEQDEDDEGEDDE